MTRAEFLKLPMDQRREILKEQAELVADIYNTSPGLCPDPIPDHIQEELTQLRARVKELESNEDAWWIKEVSITCDNLKLEARIRELEEAMRRMIGEHEPGSDCVATGPLTGTAMDYVCVFCAGKKVLADRIEKAMRKEGNE